MRHLLTRLTLLFVLAALCAPPAVHDASAQRRRRDKGAKTTDKGKADKTDSKKVQVFDFTGLDLTGQLRAPQLLYFLDRAREELERASLERRSFIPEMVRSLGEEDL